MKIPALMIKFTTLACAALSVALLLNISASAQWFNQGDSRSDFSSDLKKLEEIEVSGPARQRAVNLARATAISLNGGLSRYAPDACMFTSNASGCLKRFNSRGFLFEFQGGRPGWQILGYSPTRITEILISTDGKSVVEVISNRDIY